MDNKDYLGIVNKVFGYSGRSFLEYAWNRIIGSDLVVVEAPTGYGKTSLSQAFSLYALDQGFKSIVVYPIRSLLEDQYSRFIRLYSRLGFKDYVGTRYMYHVESRYFVKPVTLTTIDTLSLTLFGLEPRDLDKVIKRELYGYVNYSLGHYLFSRASTLLSDIVLDEVHLLADTTKSLNFLASLIKISYQNKCRMLMLSATLPRALEETLKQIHSGIEIIRFDESIDQSFVDERRKKKIYIDMEEIKSESDKYRFIIDWLKKKIRELNNKYRVLIVFNTVNEAIKMYDKIMRDDEIKGEKILLHSRFREETRRSKINRLKELANRGENYIVVTTQVIEVGVDISSNIFVTDIAPANSLIQRLGRFLRYPGENEGYLLIWFDKGGDKYYKVYDRELIVRTWEYLLDHMENFRPHLPSEYQTLLDHVYDHDDYRVDDRVDDLVGLTLQLSNIKRSVEEFIELEGSFVREGLNIPVVVEEIVDRGPSLNELLKYIVSVNISLLKSESVIGELVLEDGNCKKRVVDPNLFRSDKVWRKKLLSRVLSSDFIAFIIRGRYDDERGLVIE
ncbi:MAG: CRISPR-associated helicase Cas3' [Desulfurococcales archaeon ex4484_58]|nr:MAG: CRISPR-associated helicase Cas3' [Desulfurococcales archaeon ex4484_58]